MPPERKLSLSAATCGLASYSPDVDFHGDKVATPSADGRVGTFDQLRLPFDARDRESHLVSEAEFEEIVRQAELGNIVPPLPVTISRRRLGLSRSMSAARNSILSRSRPASADWSTIVPDAFDYDHNQPGNRASSYSTVSRETSSLTALPRPPTKNAMMAYPERPATSFSHTHRTPIFGVDGTLESSVQPPTAVHISPERIGMIKRGHQRGFSLSAATTNVTELVRKRLFKKTDQGNIGRPGSGDNAKPSEDATTLPSVQLRRTHSQIALNRQSSSTIHKRAAASQSTIINSSVAPIRSMTPSARSPRALTSLTTSADGAYPDRVVTPQSGSIHKPLLVQPLSAHPPSVRSNISTASNVTVEYAAIAEPKTRRLGGLLPPTKAQLNTVVARQQSRIVDLTLQNNVLAGQLDALRQEVESIKRAGSPSVAGSMRYQPSKDSRRQSTYTEGWEDCE